MCIRDRRECKTCLFFQGDAEKGCISNPAGTANLTKYALWIVEGPAPKNESDHLFKMRWHLGSIHVVQGTVDGAKTRLRIEPLLKKDGIIHGAVLSDMKHHEAIFESWAYVEATKVATPEAVDLLFGGKEESAKGGYDHTHINDTTGHHAGDRFIGELQRTPVPSLYHGVAGSGKTTTVIKALCVRGNGEAQTTVHVQARHRYTTQVWTPWCPRQADSLENVVQKHTPCRRHYAVGVPPAVSMLCVNESKAARKRAAELSACLEREVCDGNLDQSIATASELCVLCKEQKAEKYEQAQAGLSGLHTFTCDLPYFLAFQTKGSKSNNRNYLAPDQTGL